MRLSKTLSPRLLSPLEIALLKRYGTTAGIVFFVLLVFSSLELDFVDIFTVAPYVPPSNYPTDLVMNDDRFVYHYCPPGNPNCPPKKRFEALKFLLVVPEFRNPGLLIPTQREAFQYTVYNALKKLPDYWNVRILGTDRNLHLLQNALRNFSDYGNYSKRFSFESHTQKPFGTRQSSVVQYNMGHLINTVLLSRDWWAALHKEDIDWVLVMQTDAFICGTGNPSLKYPYLGGPSIRFPIDTPKNEKFEGHMNGGLALRHVEWTLRVVIEGRDQLTPAEYWECCEDKFFSKFFHWQKYNITWEIVAAFASDNDHTTCFISSNRSYVCPYGLHKPKGRYYYFEDECPGYNKWYTAFRWPSKF